MGRFGRHRSGSYAGSVSGPSEERSSSSYMLSDGGTYVPPSSSPRAKTTTGTSTAARSTGAMNTGSDKDGVTTFVRDNNFVTQPPKPAKGLTGKISTLFRRESSRERSGVENNDDLSRLSMGISKSTSTQAGPSPTSPMPQMSSQNRRSSPQQEQDMDDEDRPRHDTLGSQRQNPTISQSNDAIMITMPPQMLSHSNIHDIDDDDDRSIGAMSMHSKAGSTAKRIFYSSNQDDDSDDSYESRVSRVSRSSRASRGASRSVSRGVSRSVTRGQARSRSRAPSRDASVDSTARGLSSRETEFTTDVDDDDESDGGLSEVQSATNQTGGIRRYRGFSTSIKSLFLDEPLVCAAMGCFGLVLSNRTEYLLQLRNERRGAFSPRRDKKLDGDARKKSPSRIVGFGLLLTLVLMFSTFVIWGFGSGANSNDSHLNEYMNGYENYEESKQQNQWWDDYLINDDDRFGNRNYNRNKNSNANTNSYNYGGGGDQASNDDNAKAANDDTGKNVDDYYTATDDNGQRRQRTRKQISVNDNYKHNRIITERGANASTHNFDPEQTSIISRQHPIHGIFKIRDYQEGIWTPVSEFLFYEWNRGDVELTRTGQTGPRRVEQNNNDDAAADNYNSSSSTSSSSSSSSTSSRQSKRNIASDIRIALLFTFLLFLGILGRRRRMRSRFYLVRARAQDDHLYYASSDEAAARRVAFDDSREDQYEGACSHTLCGCYPIDEVEAHPNDQEVKVRDSGIFKRPKRPHHEDIVARGFNCFMSVCCGAIFKCWFQCLSICALAQEAREIRLLVPPRYQRIDYITHQPFHEYQDAVNDLRRGWLGHGRKMGGILPHYQALSRFSRWIIVLSLMSIIIIVATLYFNPRAAFSWQDIVVLIATFMQAFLVLFIVHGIFHKSDLSFDAVIKMFTAGFMIAVPSALFFEGLVVNVVLFFAWMLYYVLAISFGEDFEEWTISHWTIIWFMGELFNAYIVAALVEELCKYYTFRAVEHPDLIFLTGLHRDQKAENAVEGGLAKYPFASHQVQELAREISMDESSSVGSYRSSTGKRGRSVRRGKRVEALIEKTGTTDIEFDEDENDIRTHRQKAMAITTGMISVAVGLACAENFLYVFVLGGALGAADAESEEDRKADIIEAWIVLFFRSIFPVHALAAAIQSINVIRKFVETEHQGGHRIGVGRIVLPAVIVHGSFDAVLMCINVYIETATARYLTEHGGKIVDGEEPYSSFVVNLIAWTSIITIMVIGLLWYFYENRKQRARLIILEECEKNARSEALGVSKINERKMPIQMDGSTKKAHKKSDKNKSKRREGEYT